MRAGTIRGGGFGSQLDGVEVDRVFADTVSGKSVAQPQLQAMLTHVRDGDTVIVHSMDRLARNLDDLGRLVRELTGRGVAGQFVKKQLTFAAKDSPMATLLLSVLRAFAEFERALIRERRLEGIAVAKARGAYGIGRAEHSGGGFTAGAMGSGAWPRGTGEPGPSPQFVSRSLPDRHLFVPQTQGCGVRQAARSLAFSAGAGNPPGRRRNSVRAR